MHFNGKYFKEYVIAKSHKDCKICTIVKFTPINEFVNKN